MTTTQLDKEDVFKRIIDKATASTSIALQYILTTRRMETLAGSIYAKLEPRRRTIPRTRIDR